MSTDWQSALSEIDETIAKLQATREGILYMIATTGSVTNSQRASGSQDIPADVFLGLATGEASVKWLRTVRKVQTVSEVQSALQRGGLPHIKYNAVYNALWRREEQNGDVVQLEDNRWGLSEWYANLAAVKKRAKQAKAQPGGEPPNEEKPAPTNTQPQRTREGLSMGDAAEQILRSEDKPTHANVIVERLASDYKKTTNVKSLSGTLPQDGKKRFKNLGRNIWVLAEWPEEKYRSASLLL